MHVTVERVLPLRFDDGSPVRAASAIAPFGDGWLVGQDDATHAAWLVGDSASPLRLVPAVEGLDYFDESSGTKHLKPDWEAALGLPDGDVLLLGSGSSPLRMRSALVRPSGVVVTDLTPWYSAVASVMGIPLDLLNLEGACVVGEALRWFHRGVPTVSADVPLSELLAGGPPVVLDVSHWDLGAVAGIGLAVTDAIALPSGRVIVSAAAEDTPNPRDDGPVVGSALALLSDEVVLEVAELPRIDGRVAKVEGLALLSHDPLSTALRAVVDADDPALASSALDLRIGWR